ncbi:WbuC family cupin fold metalloprotein [Escherichia coli]|uniref:WbuC family cupin fold metalloprotein n=1 Tax=Escherichia coli TaxID=562 RepID=UPI003855EEB7
MLQPLPQRMAEAIYQEKPDMPGYTQSMSWLKDLSHTGRRWLSQQLTLMCPGTYVRPHRHPHTFELLLPLRGRFVVLNFDDRGTVTHRAILGETCTVLEMAAGTWHAVLSLDTGGIIFEVKHGGYQPVAADDYAHWAPAEGEPGTTELMAWYAQAQVGDSTFAV